MARNFRSEDKGKKVMTADGDMVGTVDDTKGSVAHIKPDRDLSQSIRRRLGWSEEGHDTYELDNAHVEDISDVEITLKKNL